MGEFLFTERAQNLIKAVCLALLVGFGGVLPEVNAQSRSNILNPAIDPRGLPELIACSQNLGNLGSLTDMSRRVSKMDQKKLSAKQIAIAKRIQAAKCDVVAVQEVLGSSEEKAKDVLEELAELIKFRTNRTYKVLTGPSNDKMSRVAFLFDESRVTFDGLTSYVAVELPKIADSQKPRLFARGPLEVRLKVNGRDGSRARDAALITFHFKSKAFNSRDGANLEWETYRMEMAEALRRIVLARHKERLEGDGSLLVLLGDRNSHYDSASAKLLTGQLDLLRFQGEAPCRLSKRGIPLCQEGAALPPIFHSVLTNDPEVRETPGSFLFEGTFSWLDDILLPNTNLPFAFAQSGIEGNYDSGVISDHPEASDHALVWTAFNW